MWTVQLSGEQADLAVLAQSLTGNDAKVSHDGQDYILISNRFEMIDEADVVHRKAEEIVAVLNGAARLALNTRQAISVGSVCRHREDGRRELFVFVKEAVLILEAFAPTIRITHADGSVEEFHPADPVREWVSLAAQNEAVTNVFRILAGGTLDWVNLYRIFEIICADVGGLDSIAKKGWATKPTMRLFKHTSNSPSVLGLEARHGAETAQPPAHPMLISEARALINSIIHAWLRSKV